MNENTTVVSTKIVDEDHSAIDPIVSQKFSKNLATAIEQTKDIVFSNPTSLEKFGESTAKILTNMAQGMGTGEAKLKSMGEIGDRITDLLKHTKDLDVASLLGSEKPGLFSRLFHKVKDPIETFTIKHKSVSEAMHTISAKLNEDRTDLIAENSTLDRVYAENLSGLDELEALLSAGILRLGELKSEYAENKKNFENISKEDRDYDKYFLELQEQQNFIDRFEQRLDRMNGSRAIILRQLPQIRIMQYTNATEAENIQDLINTAIPVWEQQINLYISQLRGKSASENRQLVKTMINETVQANSAQMKQTSLEIMNASNSSIFTTKTIQTSQNDLIEVIRAMQTSAEVGRKQRAESFLQIMEMDKQLKENIAPINNGSIGHYGPKIAIEK